MTASGAVSNRHTIYDRTSNPGIDPYGRFARVSPEGGRYSVRLGNSGIGAQAERLSYTLKVPANQPDFTLTYYYAVVFEDPNHSQHQQPRFTARVFDVAAGQYIPCASFEYIATSNLPGFTKSTTGTNIYYKDWSPVTINLSEYAGKEIRLEFTSADCTETGHFGYAYVDVSDECLGAITGNTYCGNPNSITLKGPSGFQTYNWYDANLKTLIGTGQSLNLSPVPSSNTRYALQVIPYPGFGCLDTVYTTIQQQALDFSVNNPAAVCFGSNVDLTAPAITSGSVTGLTYSYWKDANATIPLENPDKIVNSGQYYIKALNASGCFSIKAVAVVVNPLPDFTIVSPAPVCAPETIDITDPRFVSSQSPLTFTYWMDAAATTPITNPKTISASGTYYIKGVSASCFTIKPISITVNPVVNLVVVNPPSVCMGTTVNLTASAITAGSATGLTFSYWKDSNATIALENPDKIVNAGQYYIKALSASGCFSIKAVAVVVNPLPDFTIVSPAPVCAPETVDITNSRFVSSPSPLIYTYWMDAAATIPLSNPKTISTSGTYYIKGASASCFTIKSITITVNPIVNLVIVNPAGVCTGSSVDLTTTAITAGSATGLVFSYWSDLSATVKLENPDKISSSGQYYIKAVSATGCSAIKAVIVVIYPLPVFIVTSPAPVCAPLTVDITDARLVSGDSGLTFSYWMDASATIPVSNPKALTASGTYYIKGLSATNCVTVHPITVTVFKAPIFTLNTPQPVYIPSTVDITTLVNTADKNLTYRYSYTSDGTSPIDQPQKVGVAGTYYIIGINENGCELALPVYAKIVPRPSVFVPTAFTPLLQTNSHLFPFLLAVKTLLNFKIYNKWGNLVYQTSEAEPGWDGLYKSEMHFFETYTWYLDCIDELNNYYKTTGKTILIK